MPRDSLIDWTRGRPLKLEGVVVLRGSSMILRGIDLEFEAGHRYVLVGASGSGKSTLLRLLNRLEDPSRGRVLTGVNDLRDLPIRTVRNGISLVFQSPRPLPGTVVENFDYPFQIRGISPPNFERAKNLEEVGLDPGWLNRQASDLSGGERQRLAIAVALAIQPEILVLDEPTSALDPTSARLIADLLSKRAASKNLRTIVVTHHRGHAPMLGETAVLLERGRVLDVGPVDAILSKADEQTWLEKDPA